MATQYLPRNYGTPRYASASLGIPYVSAYDPNVTGRYADLMQQEYAKAMATNQALAQREAEIGDIMSLDPEGKQQVLGAFKDKVSGIRETYNQDLALAAPELARTIAKERANPWYSKNVLYNKEFERRQKLLDQYGPNIQFVRDLPQGNLNEIAMEDIGFDYYNRAHIHDLLQRQYGNMAKITTPLGMKQLEDFPAFARETTRMGLSPEQAAALGPDEAYAHVANQLQGMGIEPTPEMVNMINAEIDTWAAGNLVGGTKSQLRQIASLAGSGAGVPPGLFPEESALVELEQTIPATPTRREARGAGIDVMDRSQRGDLTYEEELALSQNPELQERIAQSPTYTAFDASVPELVGDIIPEEAQASLISDLRNAATGASNANDAVVQALENAGIVEYTTMTTPQGVEGKMTWNGQDINKIQLNKRIKNLTQEFKELRKYNNSPEGIGLAKEVNATVNKPVKTSVYGITPEANADVKEYVGDVFLATSAGNLVDAGSYLTPSGKDKPKDARKSQKGIENLQDPDKKRTFGAVTYKESGPKGESPQLILETNEGDLHVPLKGEQGYNHGIQLSLRTTDPKIVNDVFTAMYDERFSEEGGILSLAEIFGDEDLEIPGMENVYRQDVGGQRIYVAPVGNTQIQAATPNELFLKVAAYANILAGQRQITVNNPTLEFLMRRVSELMTPKERKEANLQAVSNLIQYQ